LCLELRRAPIQTAVAFPPPRSVIDQVIRDVLGDPEAPYGRRTDEVYSAVIRAVVESKYSVAGITMPGIAARCGALGALERGGRWVLPESESSRPADFVAGYLTSAGSLPRSSKGAAVKRPMGRIRVAGGRNSAFYLAHSYHTKVPPEAIQLFI